MTTPATEQAKTDAQAAFETDRAAKQQAHLDACKETDCRTCKIFRGDPLNDPPSPRCPHCGAYGYLGPKQEMS